MRAFIMILLLLLSINIAFSQSGESPIDLKILKSVIKITTSPDKNSQFYSGTGFLVSPRVTNGKDTEDAFYLVTNKHLVGNWNPADKNFTEFYKYLELSFRRQKNIGKNLNDPLRIDIAGINDSLNSELVTLHPDSSVDVAIILINKILSQSDAIDYTFCDISFLRTFDKIVEYGFNIGDQVFVLGYPLGIIPLNNLYPIAKSGYLSNIPGERIAFDFQVETRDGKIRMMQVEGKILLVDGLIVPGNSGGPVVLPSLIKTRYNPDSGDYEMRKQATENQVIGILSGNFGPSGLSLVWSTDYINEVINIELEKNGWKQIPRKGQ